MKKAFTLTEMAIVIAIITILSAILLPLFANKYQDIKTDIVEIVNNDINSRIICNEEIIYEGNYADFDMSNYTVLDLKYEAGIVIVEVVEK